MASKIKVDQIQTGDGTGTIALQNQLSGMTSASMPTGSVLQVVNHRSTAANTATTSQSYVSSGIAASITPSSTSSKIWVGVTLNGIFKDGANNVVSTKLYRGSTDIGTIDSMGTYTANSDTAVGNTSIGYLDSPSTSSAVEYKIYFASVSGAAVQINARWNSSFTTHSTITLMEIAG